MNKQELIAEYERVSNFVETVKTKSVIDKLKQLDEPKVQVPEFVADWINKCKVFEHFVNLSFALNPVSWEENRLSDECIDWLKSTSNQEVFARAWLDGYKIEQEKRYLVKMKGMASNFRFLKYNLITENFYMGNDGKIQHARLYHTRKELEEAGFGEVFNSQLFEVEEVEG